MDDSISEKDFKTLFYNASKDTIYMNRMKILINNGIAEKIISSQLKREYPIISRYNKPEDITRLHLDILDTVIHKDHKYRKRLEIQVNNFYSYHGTYYDHVLVDPNDDILSSIFNVLIDSIYDPYCSRRSYVSVTCNLIFSLMKNPRFDFAIPQNFMVLNKCTSRFREARREQHKMYIHLINSARDRLPLPLLLLLAISKNHIPVVKHLIEECGADPNQEFPLYSKSFDFLYSYSYNNKVYTIDIDPSASDLFYAPND
jgi:hypothetical protein